MGFGSACFGSLEKPDDLSHFVGGNVETPQPQAPILRTRELSRRSWTVIVLRVERMSTPLWALVLRARDLARNWAIFRGCKGLKFHKFWALILRARNLSGSWTVFPILLGGRLGPHNTRLRSCGLGNSQEAGHSSVPSWRGREGLLGLWLCRLGILREARRCFTFGRRWWCYSASLKSIPAQTIEVVQLQPEYLTHNSRPTQRPIVEPKDCNGGLVQFCDVNSDCGFHHLFRSAATQ